jgi:hypothetical protein
LGEYPTLSLEDARKEVLTRRQAVEVRGEDPAAEKAEWKKVETFGQLAAWYLSEHAKKRKKSWAEDERIIDKELLPAWRDRKAPEVTRADVRTLLRKIVERPAPVMANRVLALISRIYTKALEEDVPGVVANPALRLPKPGGDERGRDRVLTWASPMAIFTSLLMWLLFFFFAYSLLIFATSDLTLADASVKSATIAEWKSGKTVIGRRPSVFLLYAR